MNISSLVVLEDEQSTKILENKLHLSHLSSLNYIVFLQLSSHVYKTNEGNVTNFSWILHLRICCLWRQQSGIHSMSPSEALYASRVLLQQFASSRVMP